jgi:hypothetical protein
MEPKPKAKEVSGWYAQRQMTPEERAAQRRATDQWYDKKHRLNYRTVPLEIPGKMMLSLGKMAVEKGVPFSEFIEGILDSYLKGKKIRSRERRER